MEADTWASGALQRSGNSSNEGGQELVTKLHVGSGNERLGDSKRLIPGQVRRM